MLKNVIYWDYYLFQRATLCIVVLEIILKKRETLPYI